MWKYTKVCVNPRRGNTRFHMWKFTWDRVFPHMRSCISACGNTPKIVNFPTCGNTHFLVYFHMRKFERESEFPHVSLQADLWISAGKNVQEYTFFCRFPHAKIHADMWIPACGNTLNQVQKNSSNGITGGIISHGAQLGVSWDFAGHAEPNSNKMQPLSSYLLRHFTGVYIHTQTAHGELPLFWSREIIYRMFSKSTTYFLSSF